jgi:cytosine deaminase
VVDIATSGAGAPAPDDVALDAAGRVVAAAFVDAHVHLDKAFLPVGTTPPRLADAIAAVERLRASLATDAVNESARRAVDFIVAHGTVAARVHAEVEPNNGLALVVDQLELADAVAGQCELQLVAFPQLGLEAPGTVDLFAAAMALGVAVVGGCPYVDDDPVHHLDVLFDLADKHQCPVDLHLDFTDDPHRSHIDLVVERTMALGMQGHVVVGHVTTLAAMATDRQARVLDRLAQAGIALVVAPVTDLHLGGHGEPGTRSLAPVERAMSAGVRVAVATNNIANPFAPYGNGSLLHAAWLAGIARRVADPDTLLDAITAVPAAMLDLPAHGPVVGAAAHLVVLDTTDAERVVAQCPAVVATVRSGSLASGAVK